MSTKDKNQETATVTNEQPKQDSSIELTVNDLNALKQIIDVASSRGAFKPSEMTVVGTTYSKLETFLNAVSAQQQTGGTSA